MLNTKRILKSILFNFNGFSHVQKCALQKSLKLNYSFAKLGLHLNKSKQRSHSLNLVPYCSCKSIILAKIYSLYNVSFLQFEAGVGN